MRKNQLFARSWVFLGVLLLCGCADSDERQRTRTETDGWVIGDAADAGIDAAALERLAKDIEAGEFPNTHALLIEHRGSLVFERYFTGTDERFGEPIGERVMRRDSLHDLRSVTKSVTSALLGIALADGFEEKVARPIVEYLPDLELGPEQRKITLEHVLTMTAGLEWNEMEHSYADARNDAVRLYGVRDPAAHVLSRAVAHEPGSVWYYNGGCTQVLAAVILKLTGQTVDEFAKERLFAPLGITEFEWRRPQGWVTGNPSAKTGLRLTARDLAKIGSVYSQKGRWRGKQIIPEAWVDLSIVRHVREIGKWSGGGIWGYGYQWRVGDVPVGARVVAGAGNGNQRLFVLPEDGLVVTVYAGQYNRPFRPHSEMILKRVLEAREGLSR